MSQSTKQYATRLLDKLVELDKTTHAAYYEMGQILHFLRADKLFEALGYESFVHMVEEELSFTAATAANYGALYGHFKRLKYNKTEALLLLNKFGLRRMLAVLPKIDQKIGSRAIKNRIDALAEKQITFWMHDAEYAEVEQALQTMGALKTDTGRYMNSSEALIAMARAINAPMNKAA